MGPSIARSKQASASSRRRSVDGLDRMNQKTAREATTFSLSRPQPQGEGEILVLSADQKGMVMRR
jgi:hypothetical protein